MSRQAATVFGLRALVQISVVHFILCNVTTVLDTFSSVYYTARSYFKSFII